MMVNKGQDKIEFVCRDHSKRYVVCNKFKIYGTAEPLLQERQGKMTVCVRGRGKRFVTENFRVNKY